MHYNLRDTYTVYKAYSESPVDIKTYLQIVKKYMKFLVSRLLDRGEIMIPERLGTLHVHGRKSKIVLEGDTIKGLAPDWVGTKLLWHSDPVAKENKQLVYHFNEDTDGIRYKFFWSKRRVLVPNKTLFNLRMTRTNKRALSNKIKQGKEYLIK